MPQGTSGTIFDFHVVSGEVVGTDQRSDSVTTGSSRTVVYQGTGGGSGHVSTEVVVQRDIWFRTADGAEHHVRVKADIPVRVGQHVAITYLKAERTASTRKVDELFSVFVLSTDRYWTLRGLEPIATSLVQPEYSKGDIAAFTFIWIVSLALCALMVGIPIVVGLLVKQQIDARKRKAIAVDLAAAMKTEHEAVLDSTYRAFEAEQKRLAAIAAEKPLAIGAAS